MLTVRQLLQQKQPAGFVSVPLEATVFQTLQIMAEHNIGAVLVMNGESLCGIFSERDYARRVVLQGKTSASTLVGEIMTNKVCYVGPEHTVDQCMALMSDKNIRHLPWCRCAMWCAPRWMSRRKPLSNW